MATAAQLLVLRQLSTAISTELTVQMLVNYTLWITLLFIALSCVKRIRF